MSKLNTVGQHLLGGVLNASQLEDTRVVNNEHSERVNIVGAGETLTAAYEQLRNAAENIEEHLLLQNAIRRFYKHLFLSRDPNYINENSSELAIELTYAGYISNNSLTDTKLKQITTITNEYYSRLTSLKDRKGIKVDHSISWILDTLSAHIAVLISPHEKDVAFISTVFEYFKNTIDYKTNHDNLDVDEYSVALFIAVHKALLKSNSAVVRAELLFRYGVSVGSEDDFIAYNQRIDSLLKSSVTDKLYHIIDRQGAPFRIVRRMIDDKPDFTAILQKRNIFLDNFEQQVIKEYSSINERINRAIVKSVIFLIITKFIVGVAIEVPYDIWAHGHIIWQPLLINLLFPPIYMIALRLTLNLPGYANTQALVDRIDGIIYREGQTLSSKRLLNKRYQPIFYAIYGMFSLIVFGGVVLLLSILGFAFVHIAIFFVFISAASFLGFRLSRLIREIEVVKSSSNGFTFIRDIVYLPFVVVGRWMSEKYATINVVALVLDMIIELPLKTILRLIRQWGAFIDDRKDVI